MNLLVEEGFKPVRGQLTEGRFLTFEINGFALTNVDGKFASTSVAAKNHDDVKQRWIIHKVPDPDAENQFYLQSGLDKQFVAAGSFIGALSPDVRRAQAVRIIYHPDDAMYSLTMADDSTAFWHASWEEKSLRGRVSSATKLMNEQGGISGFNVYSVSYHN